MPISAAQWRVLLMVLSCTPYWSPRSFALTPLKLSATIVLTLVSLILFSCGVCFIGGASFGFPLPCSLGDRLLFFILEPDRYIPKRTEPGVEFPVIDT